MPDSQLTQPYTKTTTTFDTPLFDQLIEQLSCVSRWSTPGSLAAARGEDVSLGLPLFSATISAACLVVLGYGLALAPQPETSKEAPGK